MDRETHLADSLQMILAQIIAQLLTNCTDNIFHHITIDLSGLEDDGLGPSGSSAPDPEVLKRINQFKLGGRKESLTNIRAMNPDLSLSGNIISATFNIPYSLEYRKGADWVCRPILSSLVETRQ